MVVSDSGVKGKYDVLDDAKIVLKGIESGNRFIAEINYINGDGIVNRDPRTISGQSQNISYGFNKYWCSWDCINTLLDSCDKYLASTGNLVDVSRFNFTLLR